MHSTRSVLLVMNPARTNKSRGIPMLREIAWKVTCSEDHTWCFMSFIIVSWEMLKMRKAMGWACVLMASVDWIGAATLANSSWVMSHITCRVQFVTRLWVAESSRSMLKGIASIFAEVMASHLATCSSLM